MNNKHTCQRTGCNKTAIYSVHISLAVHQHHEPAISTPVLFLCEEHKEHLTWDNFVEPNWDRICKSITDIGRAAPVKKYSKLVLKPLPNGTHNTGGYN